MRRPTPRVLDGAGTLVRLGLAAVWLVSGVIKVSDPGQTYVAVKAFDVLPSALVAPVATALPLVELVLGLLVLTGLFTRWAAVASAVVLVVFIAGVVQSWARGLSIDCGCFGGGGEVAQDQTRYPEEIARDVGFLALAVWLTLRPSTWASADGWIRKGRPEPANTERT